jgi:hypothetical protein
MVKKPDLFHRNDIRPLKDEDSRLDVRAIFRTRNFLNGPSINDNFSTWKVDAFGVESINRLQLAMPRI